MEQDEIHKNTKYPQTSWPNNLVFLMEREEIHKNAENEKR